MSTKRWNSGEVLTNEDQNDLAQRADDALANAATAQAAADAAQSGADASAKKASNLSDLASIATAIINLGLGTGGANIAALRTALGLAAVALSGAYADLAGKPTLATVAGTGSYDDLLNQVIARRADTSGMVWVDENGEMAAWLKTNGEFVIGLLKTLSFRLGTSLTLEESGTAVDPFAIGDRFGNLAFRILPNGRVAVPGCTFGQAPAGYTYVVVDEFGDIGGFVKDDGTRGGFLAGGGGGSSAVGYSTSEVAARSAVAMGYSAAVIGNTNATAARPIWQYSVVLVGGQSLSTAWEGWPRLSKTQPHDNLMIGTSDHPTSESGTTWTQIGTLAFNALVATVVSSGVVIDDATVAGYSAGNAALGESPVVGAVNQWRHQQLQYRGLPSDSSRRLVAASCGVGGRSLEALSKGASPDLFNRLRGAATLAKGLADGASATSGLTAVLFLQGEQNAVGSAGTQDKDTYKALLATWQADVTADLATTIFGQAAPPAVFSYQTAASYVRNSNNLAISQAQLEAAKEFRDWYLVAPSYPYTDKNGHLDPNGYRWLGIQFGKVMHQVLDLGRGWKPVHPLRATWRGTQVLIDFHVPCPPLQFQPAYVQTTPTTYSGRGFRVTDDIGTITITSATLAGPASVLLELGRAPNTNPFLWYGSQDTNGNGNLCDSDPAVACANYEYGSGTGQYAGADIAALKDKPYPLWNWCVLFRMALTSDPAT